MLKIKILFLIHTLQIGGAERGLINLVNNLDYSLFDVTVMTIIDIGPFRKELNNNVKYKTMIKIPRISVKSEKANLRSNNNVLKRILSKIYLSFCKQVDPALLYRFFIKEKYDIEYAFLEGMPTKIISSSNNMESVKIARVSTGLIGEKKSDKYFKGIYDEIHYYNNLDEIVCVSEDVKAQFVKKFNFQANHIKVIHNAFDIEGIKKKGSELLSDIEKNTFTICSVGRLSKQKGFDRLIKVAQRMKNEFNFQIWIIGDGEEKDDLIRMIEGYHLVDRVILLGAKNNPYKYMQNSDLYICASREEGYSNVVIEALSLGVPVIATDCAGMKEILGNSEYGLVCKNSENGIYKAIRNVISDEYEYNRLLQKAKKKEINNMQENVAITEKFFKECVK